MPLRCRSYERHYWLHVRMPQSRALVLPDAVDKTTHRDAIATTLAAKETVPARPRAAEAGPTSWHTGQLDLTIPCNDKGVPTIPRARAAALATWSSRKTIATGLPADNTTATAQLTEEAARASQHALDSWKANSLSSCPCAAALVRWRPREAIPVRQRPREAVLRQLLGKGWWGPKHCCLSLLWSLSYLFANSAIAQTYQHGERGVNILATQPFYEVRVAIYQWGLRWACH